MKRWAAVLLILFVGPACADEADNSAMIIDAGRLGVMMDQSQRILELPDDPPGDGDTATFAILKNAVLQYGRLLPVACERHAIGAELCGPPYAPSWLSENGNPAPDVLRKRIDEATDHVAPLWTALCERLPREHDPSLCQME